MIYVRILVGGFLIVGAFALFWYGLRRMVAEEKRRSRSPFKEKMLRPPGESLRLKIDDLRERLHEQVILLSFAMMFPGLMVFIATGSNWIENLIVWAVVISIGALAGMLLWKKICKNRKLLRQYRLGFEGERYVAEKLAGLSPHGFRVYHDFLFDMKAGGKQTDFNIDHIVVGPTGVFAIETKTYRQPNGELRDGNVSHRVRSEADALVLPNGRKMRKPLNQVRSAAEDLSKWITGSAVRKVPVFPVLAMPGWFTDETTIADMLVLNPQRLVKRLSEFNLHPRLSAEEVQRIGDRIEHQCRNVDIL
ncbi:NERD domain-containing protein [Luteolibacter flavescens]|uniref:NERD domain-containing protein n=1 Tax=Luteolibacter flavescens TaxID=1859460 RepID=A0ABT3FW15_9BACT|nr:nuclease-related domain-containing protein [Luteolibacter flavescens]MCW1887419.1 NERD domain-containing protein [Luteolibacter flavescens]